MGTCIQPTAARLPRRLAGLAAAVTGLAPRSAAAQAPVEPAPIEAEPRPSGVHSSYQTWLGFSLFGPIRDPLLLAIDFSGGFYSDMHPAALVVRPALGVKLPHGFSIFAGYSYASFWDDTRTRGEEHVAFQQVAYLAPFTAVDLFGRVRLEERFRAGSDPGYRLRTLVQLNVPLWEKAPLQVVLWDEIFFALNQPADWQPTVLDLDLFFAGFGWVPDRRFRAEIGYMGALAPRPDVTEWNHCLSVGTTAFW